MTLDAFARSPWLVEIPHGADVGAVGRWYGPVDDSPSLPIPNFADHLRALIAARLSIEPNTKQAGRLSRNHVLTAAENLAPLKKKRAK